MDSIKEQLSRYTWNGKTKNLWLNKILNKQALGSHEELIPLRDWLISERNSCYQIFQIGIAPAHGFVGT